MNHTMKILLAICVLFIQAIANITNNTQWHTTQLTNPKATNHPNITTSKTLTPQSWYASQSPYAKSILESNTYNTSLVNEVDRDNLGPAIIPPAISGGITAYRAYRFAQALNKSKDIIAKANPQSEEGKSGNHKENTTNNERKQDTHKPGAPNIPNKKFDKRKGNQGYIDRESGNIYQRDRLHNRWEVYDKKGNHLGEVDNNGNPTKNPVPGRKIKP